MLPSLAPRDEHYYLLPHQWEIFESDKRHLALLGGVGSGKTDLLAVWILKKLKEAVEWPQDKAQAILAANTYDQLVHSTVRNLFGNWRKWGVLFEPGEVPKASRPFTLRVWINGGWRDILARSLNEPDTLRGTEVGFAAIDEAVGTTKAAVDVVNARVRATEQPRNQILYATTKDNPQHWLYAMFVEGFVEEVMEVVEAQTKDNPHLPADYIAGLEATYSSLDFQREVLNEWVASSPTIYHAFAADIHLDDAAEYEEEYPVIWTHDFNIGTDTQGKPKPMSSVLGQEKRGTFKGRRRMEAHAFDEIVIDSADTNDVIGEFFERHGATIDPGQVIVCGDASGRAKDTRSKTSDYGLLRDAGFKVQDVPLSNPGIRNRHNRANALLKSRDGDVRARIHPRCKTLRKGLETVQLKPGSQYLELETREQHVTTAWGYWLMRRFPEESRRAGTAKPIVRQG